METSKDCSAGSQDGKMLTTISMYWKCKVHSRSSALSLENLHHILTRSDLSPACKQDDNLRQYTHIYIKIKKQGQMLLLQKSVAFGLIESRRKMMKRILKALFQAWWEKRNSLAWAWRAPCLFWPLCYHGWLLPWTQLCISTPALKEKAKRWDKAKKGKKVCGSILCFYINILKIVPCGSLHCRLELS